MIGERNIITDIVVLGTILSINVLVYKLVNRIGGKLVLPSREIDLFNRKDKSNKDSR